MHKFSNPVDNPDASGGGLGGSSVQVLSLSLNTISVTGGAKSTGTVVIFSPPPSSGMLVTLVSSLCTAVTVYLVCLCGKRGV
jgi:hypothetical protein